MKTEQIDKKVLDKLKELARMGADNCDDSSQINGAWFRVEVEQTIEELEKGKDND